MLCAYMLNIVVWVLVALCDVSQSCVTPGSGDKFKILIERRKQKWHHSPESRPWQANVNDKLTGYMFAMRLGVPVPRVYSCQQGTPVINFAKWGTDSFVLKPLRGHNSIGVIVSVDGKDQLTSIPIKNENMKKILAIHAGKAEMTKRMMLSPDTEFIIEEHLRKKAAPQLNGILPDVKFDIFDGKILLIQYIERQWNPRGNHLSVKCIMFYDENWVEFDDGQYMKPCQQNISKPDSFDKMKDMALLLAKRLGVFYRIDMFPTDRGPVLGEFTPYTSNGLYQDSIACDIIQVWKGDNTPRAVELARASDEPEYLRGWGNMSSMDKCKLVLRAQKQMLSTLQ